MAIYKSATMSLISNDDDDRRGSTGNISVLQQNGTSSKGTVCADPGDKACEPWQVLLQVLGRH